MNLELWRHICALIRHPKRRMVELALLAAVSGASQAGVLVLVVNAALAVANGETESAPMQLAQISIPASSMLWIAGLLALIMILSNALIAAISARLSAGALERTRGQAIDVYTRADWPTQAEQREGALQETVSTLAMQAAESTDFLASAITAALGLFALLIVAATVDSLVTVIVLACGIALFVCLRPIGQQTRTHATASARSNSRFTEDVSRMSSISMELSVFGTTQAVAGGLDRANNEVAASFQRGRFAARLGGLLYRDLAILLLVVAVAALHWTSGGSRLPQVAAVVLLILRSLSYATILQSALQQMNERAPYLTILRRRLADLADHRETFGTTVPDLFGAISFVDVSYEYAPGVSVLENINLTIEPGEILGVVGASGSGKSTLLQLLLRLRRPTVGQIRVGDLPYEQISPRFWTQRVALVPQEPQLVEASISENIRFFRPHLSDADVSAAAGEAQILEDILLLPAGMATALGPRGSGLSGGQKQRVAVARALAGRPKVLILDEPTSALDGRSETALRVSLRGLHGKVAIVIVAHRPSTLSICDRVVELRDGRLIDNRAGFTSPEPAKEP